MPINSKYLVKFYPDNYYHIYNRSHSQKQMFLNHDNYILFLRLLKKYLNDHLDVFAYCLLPNHFHLFVKANEKKQSEGNINDTISNQFKKMFITYSNAFNKMHNMHGGIFETPFRRILIDDDHYFSRIIYYIHCNPLHHNIPVKINDYLYNSYKSLLSTKPTLLQREKVFEWFGGRNEFIKYHELQKSNYSMNEYFIE